MQRFRNETKMTYQQFYQQWHPFACFSTQQVRAIYPTFNRSNYLQWQRQGYIVSLRQGWYSFADCLQQPDIARYFAGKIYDPSYISLHTALSFYGIIPEQVVEITSVTTRKTASFSNSFASYSYQTVRTNLFWGYTPMTLTDGKTYMMATPEKALLDLLYLYPQYHTEADMLDLRLDDDWLADELDQSRLKEYLSHIASPSLSQRIETLLHVYRLIR